LGKEYITSSWADVGDDGLTLGDYYTSYTEVVAAYDQTRVRFTVGGTDSTKTVGGQKLGQTTSWTLYKGDVLMFGSLGHLSDLTGSHWFATKPIACYSGNYYANVPETTAYQNYLIEAELPTNTWGTQYHYTPIAGRLKNSIIRIFAKENNTTIYRDGQKIGFIKYGGGGLKDDAWLNMRADNGQSRPIVFSGDKPIGITQYNTSQPDDNIVSDPFQMVLTPLEQYQREIIFNTPGIGGGKGFPINWINIVYRTNDDSTMPDDLMFAQVQGGQFVWKSINSFSPDPGMPFSILINGHHYACKQFLLPGDGVYKIKANDPFCAYAYGFSPYDSYGHPASVALGDLERPDTLAPHPTWWMDCGGTLWYDSTRRGDPVVEDFPQNADRSNLSLINMDPTLSFNYRFSYKDFVPGDDAATTWKAWVQDPTQDARLVVTFSDRRGNDTTIEVNYYATKFAIRPDLDFGLFSKVDTVYKDIWVFNESTQSPAYLDSLSFKFKDQGFEIKGISLPQIIPPLDSIKFQIRFIATSEGEFLDSIGCADACVFAYRAQVKAKVVIVDVKDNNYSDNALTLYPNPVDDILTIQYIDSKSENISLRIIDIYGNLVDEIKSGSNTQNINYNTSKLTNGLYLVQLNTGKKIIAKTFMILR
ncbi:MAG: T9SS type A sorting domain-containing protein, partial [FCB group bacterium]